MHNKETVIGCAVLIVIECILLIFGLATRAEALTGNIDVDKARPSIDNAIQQIQPYEPPTPLERLLDFLESIWDWWWKP